MGNHCCPHVRQKWGSSCPRAFLGLLGPHKAACYREYLVQAGRSSDFDEKVKRLGHAPSWPLMWAVASDIMRGPWSARPSPPQATRRP